MKMIVPSISKSMPRMPISIEANNYYLQFKMNKTLRIASVDNNGVVISLSTLLTTFLTFNENVVVKKFISAPTKDWEFQDCYTASSPPTTFPCQPISFPTSGTLYTSLIFSLLTKLVLESKKNYR